MAGASPDLYKVVPVGMLASRLKETASRAAEHGIKDEFLATLREVAQQLALDPLSWGDEVWTYKAAGLKGYHRLFKMLSIRYAVDEAERIVYLKECRPAFNHPLAEP